MAFKVASKRIFTHTVNLPEDEGGQPQSMNVVYRVLSDEEAEGVDLLNVESTRGFLRACVKDIDDLMAEDGAAIPFTPDLLDQLTTTFDVRNALTRGYGIGLAKASAGN